MCTGYMYLGGMCRCHRRTVHIIPSSPVWRGRGPRGFRLHNLGSTRAAVILTNRLGTRLHSRHGSSNS